MYELDFEALELVSGGYDGYGNGFSFSFNGSSWGSYSSFGGITVIGNSGGFGDITVIGNRGTSFSDYSHQFVNDHSYAGGGSGYSAYGSGGGSSASSASNLVDTDGDGIPDSPEIVVTAPVSHQDIQYSNNQAQWNSWSLSMIIGGLGFFSGWGLPSYIVGGVLAIPPVNGPLTDANADLIRNQTQVYGGWREIVRQQQATRY